ncbi:phosphomannomutase [Thioclava sp. FR2]|uniref:phosphomannomutase n=1 Tax=Thioclava sp. FR2 TaxID=3445780 RepID=UPI003EB83D5A
MAPKFGTSGLRGLVVELTDTLVGDYVRAFVSSCPTGTGLWVGRDLRPSSPDIAKVVLRAAQEMGLATVDCGAVPTPALAMAAMSAGAAAIMVTGSHIPADRNGLKFYVPDGEISKSDEAAILASLGQSAPQKHEVYPTVLSTSVGADWVNRYTQAFGDRALHGLRLGVWTHSAVSRDLLLSAIASMGGEAIDLGRSETFVPVDTEAVPAAVRQQLDSWVSKHQLDAILSTDGDGDRPLLVDETGAVVPGDVLGQITAAVIGAKEVVTPVSSNTGVEKGGKFLHITRTRIGSPYVISGMQSAGPGAKVVGYEANGGFLLGFKASGPAGMLDPLWTRDSLLPLIAVLTRAKALGRLSSVVAAEPKRFTATDRLEDIPTDRSKALIAGFEADPAALGRFLSGVGDQQVSIDRTDGLRITLASGRILHMRPSGNAPEFRLYVEADSPDLAREMVETGLRQLKTLLLSGQD